MTKKKNSTILARWISRFRVAPEGFRCSFRRLYCRKGGGKTMDAQEIENRARELAKFAQEDQTQSPNWQLPQRLQQMEQELIVDRRDFEGYTSVCRQAVALVEDPVLRATFRLGELNGMRRIPDGNAEAINLFATTLKDELRTLPAGIRTSWLRASFGYNMGVFARDTTDFLAAVSYQEMAADGYRDLGDPVREAISRFLIAVERVHLALFRGDTDVQAQLDNFHTAYDQALKILNSVAWWVTNVHLHTLLLNAWAGGDLNYRATEALGFILTLDEAAAKKSAPWMRLAQAIQRVVNRDQNARRSLEKIIENADTDCHGDVTVTAYLLLGRLLRKTDPEAATTAYEAAVNWPKLKGQVPLAIAERELADYQADPAR